MGRNEEIETGRVKIENEEMQGPRLHIPFLSEPVETLDSGLGPRSWVDNSLSSLRISSLGLMRTLGPDLGSTTVESIERRFPIGNDSVRQNCIHDGWDLPLEFSAPTTLNVAVASNKKKKWQFFNLQRAVQI